MPRVPLPYRFEWRSYQARLWAAFPAQQKRAVVVWHRRAGKDKTALQIVLDQAACERVGLYYFVFPTYNQGRKDLWDAIGADGMPFREHIPAELTARVKEQEMQVTLVNGSLLQIVGAEEPNRLRGSNPVGVVYSEYAVQNPAARQVIQPVLAENGGWECYLYTPLGKNHGWDIWQTALANPTEWYADLRDVTMTRRDAAGEDGSPVVPLAAIEQQRREGYPEALIQQEYYCSFEAGIHGSYYGDLLAAARAQGRIATFDVLPTVPIDTYWDLGVSDAMAIWVAQTVGFQHRLLDYYEQTGEGFAHYADWLSRAVVERWGLAKATWGTHYGPHDVNAREISSGKTRIEEAKERGLVFKAVPRLMPTDGDELTEGINAVRRLIPRCVYHAERCARGLDALGSYRKKWNASLQRFDDRPLHDWASNGADAFRTMALAVKDPVRVGSESRPPTQAEIATLPARRPWRGGATQAELGWR